MVAGSFGPSVLVQQRSELVVGPVLIVHIANCFVASEGGRGAQTNGLLWRILQRVVVQLDLSQAFKVREKIVRQRLNQIVVQVNHFQFVAQLFFQRVRHFGARLFTLFLFLAFAARLFAINLLILILIHLAIDRLFVADFQLLKITAILIQTEAFLEKLIGYSLDQIVIEVNLAQIFQLEHKGRKLNETIGAQVKHLQLLGHFSIHLFISEAVVFVCMVHSSEFKAAALSVVQLGQIGRQLVHCVHKFNKAAF
ncbi:hypothetical protein BpHYR1_037796 [Brachionus plicatilis]|uniref:Uncharacterized protein n=1 Tax=Brachionus plicatilis TaxID=10195 RepID=A0A3M7PAL1_BRAPC|nr:hypothetical protein BpHYR1_037796 [Brachionus plicatilis]